MATAPARRHVLVGGAAVSGGTVGKAARVVAGFRPQLQDCYSRERSEASGAVRFTLAVADSGSVANVGVQRSGGLPPAVVECATARVKQARFEAPDGGSATIQMRAVFSINGKPIDRSSDPNTPDEPATRRGRTRL
jgi:hypothetical protein